MDEITLFIDSQIFKVKKNLLVEHSDYFRAMFSGNYKEEEQCEISIDIVDATSMEIILKYMDLGHINLFEYPLAMIGDLAVAANFLQMTELLKQIEYTLEIETSVSNWMDIMVIAENSSLTKLEPLSATYGLLSFKNMKPDSLQSIHILFWYLSHPYLGVENELDVFKFGCDWITHNEIGPDALLIILGCLDLKKLKSSDFKEMKTMVREYENSLAAKLIECFLEISIKNCSISTSVIIERKQSLIEMFSERVYNEILNIARESRSRMLEYTPSIPIWILKDSKPEVTPHYLYTFNENTGLQKWLEVAEKDLWGWNVVGWGPTKLVVVGGEIGRGTGVFPRDVKVYDTLRQEWTRHGVQLPAQRHGGVAVVGDSLFIIGGAGAFRIVLDRVIIYDLKERTHRKVANLPDAVQNPAVCVHKDTVYVSCHNIIYKYEDLGECDRWTKVVVTNIGMTHMVSYGDYIYCTQNYFSHLYRFRPEEKDPTVTHITNFRCPSVANCNLGNRLIFFTRAVCGQSDVLSIEEYTENKDGTRLIWSDSDSTMKVNDVAGSCSLVMTIPPVRPEVSQYAKQYLKRYPH